MFHVSYAAVFKVPDSYPTIQAAIDAADVGDTIQVSRRSGESQSVYYERIVVNKQLTIVGESRDTVIIDGGNAGTVVRIQADGVRFEGFTVRNAGQKYSGIRANSYSYLVIANNTIKTNKNGIVLLNSNYNTVVQNLLFDNSAAAISLSQSIGNNVSGNDASESAYGITLSSTNATFAVGNTVTDNSYGIYLEYSSNDTVDGNTLLRNRVDGIFPNACHDIIVSNNEASESAYALQLYDSEAITVLGNNATGNSYGIYLAYSGPSNTVENNTISRNDWGVALYGSSGNTFTGNILSYNDFGVEPVFESSNNLFYHNNFVENVEQVVWNPNCLNTWDNGTEGNYWSDYTGTDSDEDGIGDTAYSIDPMNKDRYPLMSPWETWGLHDVAVKSIWISRTLMHRGYTVIEIYVVVENEGASYETFNVVAYYNSSEIETEVVTLSPGGNTTLTFTWDALEASYGDYTISAQASVVLGEEDVDDNSLDDGVVNVTVAGDVNGDGVVELLDAALISAHWYPGPPLGPAGYSLDTDINEDGNVDIFDAAIMSGNWLKSKGA